MQEEDANGTCTRHDSQGSDRKLRVQTSLTLIQIAFDSIDTHCF